jgi:hypothetical protein
VCKVSSQTLLRPRKTLRLTPPVLRELSVIGRRCLPANRRNPITCRLGQPGRTVLSSPLVGQLPDFCLRHYDPLRSCGCWLGCRTVGGPRRRAGGRRWISLGGLRTRLLTARIEAPLNFGWWHHRSIAPDRCVRAHCGLPANRDPTIRTLRDGLVGVRHVCTSRNSFPCYSRFTDSLWLSSTVRRSVFAHLNLVQLPQLLGAPHTSVLKSLDVTCNGSRYSRTPDHTGGGVQVTLFPLLRKRLQSGPEQSRARPTGAAKRTLDGEDRFEMIEKGETARKLLATSVTKSASIGAIDRDPLQLHSGVCDPSIRAPRESLRLSARSKACPRTP